MSYHSQNNLPHRILERGNITVMSVGSFHGGGGGGGGGVNSTLFPWHQVWVPNTLGLRGLTLVSKQHDLLCKYIYPHLLQSMKQPGGYSNKTSPYICNLLKSVHA